MAAAPISSTGSRTGPLTAGALLALAAALIIFGLFGSGAGTIAATPAAPSDLALYGHIVQAVAQGRSYYDAAPNALRQNGYPLRPFLAIRPPALAVTLALLPDAEARRSALLTLAASTMMAWAWRLRALWRGQPRRYILAIVAMGSGVYPLTVSSFYLLHEVWAGLLMALSLALHRPGRWLASLIVGLGAALLRELAIPFLVIMAVLGWREGRRSEAFAWMLAVVVATGALAAHALAVGAITQAGDPQSPGWLAFGGWRFVLAANDLNTFLVLAPTWCAALAFPLALLGLSFPSDGVGLRVTVVVWGFVAGLMVVGRPQNSYWGLMIAPLWPLGLVWTDTVVMRLITKIRQHLGSESEVTVADLSFPHAASSSFKDS